MTKALSSLIAAPTDSWTSSASDNWSLGSNWSLGAPTSGETVSIDTVSPLTVTFDRAGFSIAGLDLVDDALTLVGGSLATTDASNFQSATITGPRALFTSGATTVEGLTLGGGASWFNSGTITQSGGSVAIGDAAAALIDNAAGATWIVADDSGLTQGTGLGSHFLNAGTFQKTSSGSVALIKANFVSTGTIASAAGGDIEFDGKSSRLSGTYIGSGMVDYGPDGVSTLGDIDVTASCCQTNWGFVNLTGTMTMHDGSTIMNAAGAHWNFFGDSSLLLAAGEGSGPDINGDGAIAKTKGAGVSVVSVDANVSGSVTVATGTIAFEGASSAFSGFISGAGTFEIAAGQATLSAGARLGVAHWTLAGGVTTLAENVSYAGAFAGQTGATLALGGETLSLTGAAQLTGFAIGGAGVLHTMAGVTVSGLTIGGTEKFVASARVTQSDDDVTLGDANASDSATLVIGAGGTWDFTDAHSLWLGADSASTIFIAGSAAAPGLLEKTGAGVSNVGPSIVNSGANVVSGAGTVFGGIEVATGTLDIQGTVGGKGADNIVDAGTLEFDKFVSGAQTVFFSGASGTLDLTDLADFHASISGFDTVGIDDTLLIGGGWTFAGAQETATAATLTFSGASGIHKLTFGGNYLGGAFSAQSLAGGDLKVGFSFLS